MLIFFPLILRVYQDRLRKKCKRNSFLVPLSRTIYNLKVIAGQFFAPFSLTENKLFILYIVFKAIVINKNLNMNIDIL